MELLGYLKDDYPTEKGKISMALRCENELYLSEIILSGLLDNLSPIELASVVCALETEEIRNKDESLAKSCSKSVRKILNQIKDIKRKIFKLERDFHIENPMYINTHFCWFIEYWIASNMDIENDTLSSWEAMFEDTEFSQGDVVRTFKRTIDVLRQLVNTEGIDPKIAQSAKEAIRYINVEPVNVG